MAGVLIKDATGDGFAAKVDNFNRLRTFATSTTQEHHGTGIGVNFMFSNVAQADTLTLPDATSNASILYIKNTNANALLVVTKISFSSDTAGVVARLVKNMALGTIGANTSGIPANLNFQSGVVAASDLEVWDEAGAGITGLTSGETLEAYSLGLGRTVENIDGGIDIGPNNTLVLQLSNTTGGAAEVSAAVRAFYESTSI